MLSYVAYSYYIKFLSLVSEFSICPYKFEKVKGRFVPANVRQLTLYYFHFFCTAVLWIIDSWRLVAEHFFNAPKLPLPIKILTIVWNMAYGFTVILYYQFEVNRHEIMGLMNAILEQIDRGVFENKTDKDEKSQKEDATQLKIEGKAISSISIQVIMSLIIFAVNPFFHSFVVFDPCCPLLSELLFNCTVPSLSYEANPISLLNVGKMLLLFMKEYYGIFVVCATWSLNWGIIMLALTWIRGTFRKGKNGNLKGYRKLQLIMSLLNNAVAYYLAVFPPLIFFVLGLMLFGCIRLWRYDARVILMFPACGLRCAFESITPLAMAGKTNAESWKFLDKVKRREARIWTQNWGSEASSNNWRRRFAKSCPTLRCLAGGMYSFENSIVISSLDNLNQLTLNLLIAFK